MLSFVGWEAVAPLTGRLRAGQLSRVIGTAFTVTALLYLGLAIATVGCLGRGADLAVPLADLLQLAVGPAGRAVAAAAALVLTAGSSAPTCRGDRDVARASAVRGQIGPNGPPHPPRLSAHLFLVGIALAGLALIGMSALRLADTAVLVSVPTTKLVIDTTNQFGRTANGFGVFNLGHSSAAAVNSAKAPQAIWVKAFNTLTAGFQASSAGRTGPDRVVIFYATDHDDTVPSSKGSSTTQASTRSAPARWPAPKLAIRSPRATCTARSSTTRTPSPPSRGSTARPRRAAADPR